MDIVERLRGDYSDERLELAANEIERLREELKNPVCDCPYLDDLIKKDDEIERLRDELKAMREICLVEQEYGLKPKQKWKLSSDRI